MKYRGAIPFAVCVVFLTCSKEPLSPAGGAPGSAQITVRLGKVGNLTKRTVTELDTLTVTLSAAGEYSRISNTAIDGNGPQTITKIYGDMASLKTWTVTAAAKDTAGKVIFSGSIDFEVQPKGTADVTLDLAAQYSMLSARFFPRRGDADRCILTVDNTSFVEGSFNATSPPKDTVSLSIDYVTANREGIRHAIRLSVWSAAGVDYRRLYEGDTVITVVSGVDASYNVTLRSLIPNPSLGSATISVVLGTIGTVAINGEIEDKTRPTDLYVDSSAADGGDGLSWARAMSDLQKALGAAEVTVKTYPGTGVTIHIARGTYYPGADGDSSISFSLRNNIRLIGGYPRGGGGRDTSNTTILSGAKGVIHIVRAVNVDSTAIMDGVTVSGQGARSGGSAMWCVNASPKVINCNFTGNRFYQFLENWNSDNHGGAVFDSLSSPLFEKCLFTDNWTDRGCGIYNVYSSPVIADCRFIRNNSSQYLQGLYLGGGAIANVASSPRIANCLFEANWSVSAGAICNLSLSFPTIDRCVFKDNSAREFMGGAILNSHSDPLISNCVFTNNFAQAWGGGAVCNDTSSPIIVNCTFSRNSVSEIWTSGGGGAIADWNSSSPVIINCTFDSNFTAKDWNLHGGAIYDNNSSATVTNCTFTHNSAQFSGAYHGTSGIITNCIFWGDSAQDRSELTELSELSPGILQVKNCIIAGGYPGGISIIDQNPNLGPLTDNGGAVPTCALPESSPARDAGTTMIPSGVDISIDARGMPRSDGKPDIGAYEIQ